MLNLHTLRQKYLVFFTDQTRRHVAVPSSALVPENDPTTLFTGSGMQPMMPYLLGAKHPKGTRLTDSQKCFRAEDIEEVGDNRHTTFFEMLGNWSFGDYFKTEQLSWFFQFLTQEAGLDPARLSVSVFAGDQQYQLGRDEEAVKIWQDLFAQHQLTAQVVDCSQAQGLVQALASTENRIFYYPAKKNWWSRAGAPGNMPVGEPGGPDSEVFYDFGAELHLHEQSPFADQPCHINCDCGRFMEIGNSVFMQYQKTADGFEPLAQKNIDFGGGLERILAAAHHDRDVFKTQAFTPIIEQLEKLTGIKYVQANQDQLHSFRVIADHLRGAVMLAADGVYPANKEQGYFARRLVRRAVRYGKKLGIDQPFIASLVPAVSAIFADHYLEVKTQQAAIETGLAAEEKKFRQTLEKGLREFSKLTGSGQPGGQPGKGQFTADQAFKLYESYGFPLELSLEEAKQQGLAIADNLTADFAQQKKQHADSSRTASAGKFKGGLANHSDLTTKYHTATHLIHAALRQILGEQVGQKGSNITDQRLRFDFSHDQAITAEQLQQVEALVNRWIAADLPVTKQAMAKEQALAAGALAFFGQRYPDQVTVYTVGQPGETSVSKELCGGPHVTHLAEIGPIEIFKEKSQAAGIRRVYARLKQPASN